MAQSRSVTDYLNLQKRRPSDGVSRPKIQAASLRLVLTENAHDEYGPIEVDALYLVHFTHRGTNDIAITQVFLRTDGRWVRVNILSQWTRERMLTVLHRHLVERVA